MELGVQLSIALLAIPLFSATVIALFFRKKGGLSATISVVAAVANVLVAFHLIFRLENFEENFSWLNLGGLNLDMGFLVNDLAKLMLFIVVVIGLLVHIFSLGYMKSDPYKARFFGGLSIFMFSMIGLVLADNLFLLFVFWELVGFSSYLLINFYFDKPSAVAASKKAFIANRVGDFGFLLGIIGAYWAFGTLNLSEIATVIGSDPTVLAGSCVGLLLFCGTVGKSGQLPLHVWLPDAMEGPTPVSALIHAATMVAAGIFLLCRTGVIMTVSELEIIAWVGAATAIYAGFCAITQRDIKKILAYSTVSQLGYMVAAFALGTLAAKASGVDLSTAAMTGGIAAAMFHLTTHAFFKALLFLGSGSIINACHHEQDIFLMGGLMKKLPITFFTFTLGYLALIGAPFLSGFFSKDAILIVALEANSNGIFYVLVAAAVLTALYMTRLWIIVFLGRPKSDQSRDAKENGLIMTLPLIVLAIGAVFSGYAWAWPEAFSSIREAAETILHSEAFHTKAVVFGSSAAALGFIIAFVFYKVGSANDPLQRKFPAIHKFLNGKLWFDEIYGWYIAKIQDRVASAMHFIEQIFISGVAIRGLAGITGLIGIGLRSLHVGSLHGYVYWFVAGLLLFGGMTFAWF